MHKCNIKLVLFLFVLSILRINSSSDEYSDPLKVWNLQDAVAYPGQAFIYQLPRDYKRFQVTEKNLNFLPDWLTYDDEHSRLVGVPSQYNVNYYEIEVQASKELWQSSESPYDSFCITVANPNIQDLLVQNINDKSENDKLQQPMFDRGIYCSKKKETTTTVILDLDYDDSLSPPIKFSIIETFSKYYEIPLKSIKLLSSSEIESKKSLKSSIIYAYPGDFSNKHIENKVFLHWTIGCGKVQKKQLSVLKKIEETNSNLKNILNYNSLGFYVTNNNNAKEVETRKKHKRYLQNHYYPTSTATISILPPSSIHTTTTQPLAVKTSKGNKKSKKPSTTSHVDFKANKSLSVIKVLVGEVFQMKIGKEYFSRTPKHLRLTTSSGQSLTSTSWIKLDSKNRLYGIPLLKQQGVQQYVLKARDSHGNEADLKLDFNVVRPMLDRAPFKMSVVIDNLEFERFTDDVDLRMDVTQKLASALGYADSLDVLMTDLLRGSVDYTWTNKSMLFSSLESKHRGCSVSAVKKVFNHMINASTGHLEDHFNRAMKSYRVSYAEAYPTGGCEKLVKGRVATYIRSERVPQRDRARFHSTNLPPYDHSYDQNGDGSSRVGRVQNMDELFKQILVPSLIVVALVLLALIIACMAFSMRSNKNGEKLKGVDDYLRKGTPVIFAHELDEHPSSLPSKRPLITSTQRSPKPPNYRQHMISATSTAANLPAAEKMYVAN